VGAPARQACAPVSLIFDGFAAAEGAHEQLRALDRKPAVIIPAA